MGVAFTGGHRGHARPIETAVEQLPADQARARGVGRVVLELVEEPGLGGRRRHGRLCGRKGVEDVCSVGELLG